MSDKNEAGTPLLPNWGQDNDADIERIMARHLGWVQAYVHKKLGDFPRHKSDTGDIVQEAMMQFLKYGPRFQVTNDAQFRALLCRIVKNVMSNEYDWFTACRRSIARERPLPSDTVLNLNALEQTQDTPSQIVNRNEEEAWLRLGIEFLDSAFRKVIVFRNWMNLSFTEIGKRLGISKAGARKRYYNAVNALIKEVKTLKSGGIDAMVEEI